MMSSVQQIGSEADHIRDIIIDLNAMCSLKNVFQFARDKYNSTHFAEKYLVIRSLISNAVSIRLLGNFTIDFT